MERGSYQWLAACHFGQLAACQFGQLEPTAGSPLNSLILCILRYFASLSDPVHISAWVDDLHFLLPNLCTLLAWVTKTDVLPVPCPTKRLAQDHWFALAHTLKWSLNLPWSKAIEGKGFTVSQSSAFTGFNIDTCLGTITMLTEKFDSVLLGLYSFRILAITTCRLTADLWGEI